MHRAKARDGLRRATRVRRGPPRADVRRSTAASAADRASDAASTHLGRVGRRPQHTSQGPVGGLEPRRDDRGGRRGIPGCGIAAFTTSGLKLKNVDTTTSRRTAPSGRPRGEVAVASGDAEPCIRLCGLGDRGRSSRGTARACARPHAVVGSIGEGTSETLAHSVAVSVYDHVGTEFFTTLVDRFYDAVETDPVLRPLYPETPIASEPGAPGRVPRSVLGRAGDLQRRARPPPPAAAPARPSRSAPPSATRGTTTWRQRCARWKRIRTSRPRCSTTSIRPRPR